MSISNTVRKAGPYTGNDLAAVFAFAFKVFTASDLLVVRADTATGVETPLVLGTDYTVALNVDQEVSPGGTVTLPVALASTLSLTLTSVVPNSQPTAFTNTGGFYPAVLNAALDRVTILVQQLAEQVGRAIKVPISSAGAATADYLMGLLNVAVAAASSSAAASAGSATAASGSATASAGSATAASSSAASAAASVSSSLPKAGGTMTGPITLAADAASAMQPTTKQQFDAALAALPASSATTQAGLSASEFVTPAGLQASKIIGGAFIATTSGTSIDLSTVIPSWAKRITIVFNGVSTNGSSGIQVQIGSGSYATSGYASSGNGYNQSSSSGGQSSTSGFVVFFSAPSNGLVGHMQITPAAGLTYVESHSGLTNAGTVVCGGGNVTLGASMDRCRIASVNGTDTFDAGSVSLTWE